MVTRIDPARDSRTPSELRFRKIRQVRRDHRFKVAARVRIPLGVLGKVQVRHHPGVAASANAGVTTTCASVHLNAFPQERRCHLRPVAFDT